MRKFLILTWIAAVRAVENQIVIRRYNKVITGNRNNFELIQKTIQVPVTEIISDIKKRIPDKELMKKYGLSESGLKTFFDKLLRAMSNGSHQIQVESDG